MEHSALTIFQHLIHWLDQNKHCWLITVVETWGSSPRPKGSLMACNNNNEMVGSISGGCVEEELLNTLSNVGLSESTTPWTLRYGATAQEQDRLQLPCGGHLTLFVEPILPIAAHRGHCITIERALAQRKRIQREVHTKNSNKLTRPALSQPHVMYSHHHLIHTIGPHYQLLLIGAGPVSMQVASTAVMMDYAVTVCDPRPNYARQWPFQDITLTRDMPDDVVRAHFNDPNTAIVTLAHDPRLDDMALMEALRSKAFYVGAMGSDRTSQKRRTRLAQLNLTQKQIARLHAPVGLAIGSKTPAEIAISIMAELTLVKSNRSLDTTSLETEAMETETLETADTLPSEAISLC